MKPALLLVDIQRDYLDSPNLQPPADILISNAGKLLQHCRESSIPVIHIWTTVHRQNDRRLPHWKKNKRWICVAGTRGHQTPDELKPRAGETIIHKTGFNAFKDGQLETALKNLDCSAVIVAGLHLHACVRAIAVECLERDLRVFAVDDALASNDPILSAATRRWLAARCVEFKTSDAILPLVEGHKTRRLMHRSPRTTAEILFEIPIADGAEILAVTIAAQKALTQWRHTRIEQRAAIFERVADHLEKSAVKFARQMAVDIGKPLTHGLEEMRRAATNARDVARRARMCGLEKCFGRNILRREPLGVVALISPWNNPVAISIGKIAPALLFRNTVVWKPAPAAKPISEMLLQLLRDAGVPRDAIQILNGDHTTAQYLAADTNINAVTLTASAQAGYAIQEICARRFLPLQAELNGNNAAIVWSDAELEHAASQIAWGAFGFAGQRCTANRRVIVHAKIFDAFMVELKKAAEKLHWGDPLETTTDIGPVINTGKRDEQFLLVQSALDSKAASRAEFLFKKEAEASWLKAGAYAQPVVVVCDEAKHPLVQEETMSPLLVAQRARNFGEALKLCNGVRHGLVAALFSESKKLQEKFLEEAQAGVLKINASTAGVDVLLPFGGWKMSGLGPAEHGDFDVDFYTRPQTIYGFGRCS